MHQKIITVYHGTDAEFGKFKSILEEDSTYEYYGDAIYFSESVDIAKYYGSRLIEINVPKLEINIELDGNTYGMSSVEGLCEAIESGGVIRVNNVADYNLAGAQCKNFDADELEVGDYKYLRTYFINMLVHKHDAIELRNSIKLITNRYVHMSESIFKKNHYNIHLHLTPNEYAKFGDTLKGERVIIEKNMGKSPSTSAVIIFAGETGIAKLNDIYTKTLSL